MTFKEFLKYLGENRGVINGARMNDPAVTEIEIEAQKSTDPNKLKNLAKNYLYKSTALATVIPTAGGLNPIFQIIPHLAASASTADYDLGLKKSSKKTDNKVVKDQDPSAPIQKRTITVDGKNRDVEIYPGENGNTHIFVPGKNVRAGKISGHSALFNNEGKLVNTTAMEWEPEAGWHPVYWPTKNDSILNVNFDNKYLQPILKQKKQVGGKISNPAYYKNMPSNVQMDNTGRVSVYPTYWLSKDDLITETEPNSNLSTKEYDVYPLGAQVLENYDNKHMIVNIPDTVYGPKILRPAKHVAKKINYVFTGKRKQGGLLMRKGGKIIEVPFND